MKSKVAPRFIRFVGSSRFFAIIVTIFVLQAAWIALSARYPQAFDEQFHFGLIQFYSHHWSPFVSSQPAGTYQFGALTRDPSYLYHYLMSFPYRLMSHWVHSQTSQIIIMRFLNIGLLASSLWVFRRALRFSPASESMINVVLFCYVLTPVMPLLGSQINYDNLLIPLAGLSIWLTLRLMRQLREQNMLSLGLSSGLACLWLLGSLVKYAFLPIAAAEFLILVPRIWKLWRSRHKFWQIVSKWRLLIVAVVVLGSSVLFLQRYGVNLVRYHTLTPECDQVLSIKDCKAYAPWARNYDIVQHKTEALALSHELTFPFVWLYHCMGELLFTIGSSFNDGGTVDYFVGTQLVVMEVVGWTIFVFGLALVAVFGRRLWQYSTLRLYALVVVLYIGALAGQNFLDYVHLGDITAIHGRYLLPLLPMIYVIIALAARRFFGSLRVTPVTMAATKAAVAAGFMVILFLQGGFVTYLVRNEPDWLWPQSSTVQTVNKHAKRIAKRVVVDTKSKR